MATRWWVLCVLLGSACTSNGIKSAATVEVTEQTTFPSVADAGAISAPPDTGAVGDAAVDGAVMPPLPAPAPMSLISVRKPVVTSAGAGSALVDDGYFDQVFWDVQAASQPWAAIDLGSGPSRIFVQLYASQIDSIPRAYRLETSADSTNGKDGTWTARARVDGNEYASRAHLLDFARQRWLRLVIEQAVPDAQGQVRLNELGVRDASQGASDGWIFLGDSITATTLHPGPSTFAGMVHAAHPAYYPLAINAGIGGTRTVDCLETLDAYLAAYPDVQNWAVSYGTNDAASGDVSQAVVFGRNLRAIVERLQRAGKRTFVPRIPFRTEPDVTAYNRQLDLVVAATGASLGPDLYTYFRDHQDQLYDGVHPDDSGAAALNRLWAEAVSTSYR